MTDQSPIESDTGAKPHRSIAAALAAAQSEMGRAKRSAKNPHFKSKYADLDSVCDAALPALNRHGIAVVQPLQAHGDQWVQITRFVHGETGETMETPVPLIVGKSDMQGFGSAMTYARRYGLMALAGIAPEDDDGNAASDSLRRDPPAPRFDARQVADRIITAINKADSLDALSALWADSKTDLRRAAEADGDAYNDIVAAKDARKAALTPAPSADLGDDEIPY